jgi:hypothetical protein
LKQAIKNNPEADWMSEARVVLMEGANEPDQSTTCQGISHEEEDD